MILLLLSKFNFESSYVHECQIKGLFHNVDLLNMYLMQYKN